jgi:transketolase
MDFIADRALTNVVAILNCNTLGQSDFVVASQRWRQLQRKADAFNWSTVVIDGHDPEEIENALCRRNHLGNGKPLCVLARTVKGWGVPSLTGLGHHGAPVAQGQLSAALADLDRKADELGAGGVRDVPEITPPPKVSIPAKKSRLIDFAEAASANQKVATMLLDTGAMSPRRAFGLALKALAAADVRVVALDADVKNSTYALDFAKAYPERYFEARIAEQNMMSVAAGLWRGGPVPFDQIEMAIVGGANLRIVGTHVGVTLASDDPSQMALADISFMRAFAHRIDCRGDPAITVLTPCGAVNTYALVLAMADFLSACYLRAVRADLPVLYDANTKFPFRGHKLLRRGSTSDRRIVLIACGFMVHSCLKAAEELAAVGIDVSVVDAYALPMDTEPVLALAGVEGTLLTVEDNYVGGLGSEIA